MESAGQRLKKIRLEKGLSLEEVAKKTKIHLNILKAIEEDSFSNISPIYIKGFLKIYCSFLGQDPREYVPDFKEQPPVRAVAPQREGKATISLRPNIRMDLAVKIIFVLVLILLFSWGIGKIISRRHYPAQAKKSESVVLKPKSKPSETISAKHPSSVIRLGIRAREDCLVSLKADGKTLFNGVLKKGKSESWQAKEKIELSLGNAGAVDLTLNEARIGQLGKRGQALKNILITKEGLKVR